MQNVLYYKYVPIDDPISFRDHHQQLCDSLQLKGKVLVAKEGINGCVSGTEEDTLRYIEELRKDSRFSDVECKITSTSYHDFKRMIVRIRDQIVTAKFPVDITKKAPYVEPTQLREWFDHHEEMVLIDARNDYESKIGKFEHAITPSLQTFSEWKKYVDHLHIPKNKRIITYCTGGIRCEKASAYLQEKGFTNVFQLHGGIINYGKECGNAHWQGKCFVFDDRVAIDIDSRNSTEPITTCVCCNLPSAEYHNCALRECDDRFICCPSCLEKRKGCCSKKCLNEFQKKNYYQEVITLKSR